MRTFRILKEFDYQPEGASEPVHVSPGDPDLTSEDLSDWRADAIIAAGCLEDVTP